MDSLKYRVLAVVTIIQPLLNSCDLNTKKSAIATGIEMVFLISKKLGNKVIKHEIKRQDSLQSEVDKKTGNYSKLSVNWIDNCTFITLV